MYVAKIYMPHYGCEGGKLVWTSIPRQGDVAGARSLALITQFTELSCVQLVEAELCGCC